MISSNRPLGGFCKEDVQCVPLRKDEDLFLCCEQINLSCSVLSCPTFKIQYTKTMATPKSCYRLNKMKFHRMGPILRYHPIMLGFPVSEQYGVKDARYPVNYALEEVQE